MTSPPRVVTRGCIWRWGRWCLMSFNVLFCPSPSLIVEKKNEACEVLMKTSGCPTCDKIKAVVCEPCCETFIWIPRFKRSLDMRTSRIRRLCDLQEEQVHASGKVWEFKCTTPLLPVWFILSRLQQQHFLIWQLFKCINSKRNKGCKGFHIEKTFMSFSVSDSNIYTYFEKKSFSWEHYKPCHMC